MFVNGVAFLVTLSRDIRLFTAEHVPSRTAKQLGSSLMKVVQQLYGRGGYVVNCILMDLEFEKVKDECPLVEINTTAAREHVGEAERGIRTIKERARCVVSMLPYTMLPKQMVIHLIYYVVLLINAFPAAKGISERYSPREIITQRVLEYGRSLPDVIFGTYVEGHHDHDVTNTQEWRTFPGIYLGQVGNIQGSKKIFDLKTGIVKSVSRMDVFPMPDRVIKLVDKWGKQYQKTPRQELLTFRDREGKPFSWENEDLHQDVTDDKPIKHACELPAEMPGIELVDDADDQVVQSILPPSDDQLAHEAEQKAGLKSLSAPDVSV